MKFLKRKVSSAFNPQNKVRIVHGGPDYFDTLTSMIRGAASVIHFQTYIFNEDATGLRIRNELIDAGRRGVRIYLLCDGYATGFREAWLKELQEAGIRFRYFEPLFSSRTFYFGRRLHHKVVVADERFSLVGGINISDNYHGTPTALPWLDYAVFAEGQASATLHQVCENLWSKTIVKNLLRNVEKKVVFTGDQNHNPVQVRVCRNDWVRGQTSVLRSYVEMLHHARKDVLILSSYFLPNRLFRLRMQNAARRGVRIRVVLAGISDVRLSKPAARFLYAWMFRNNMEIYEYTKTVMHAKLATCDGLWMTIGSYNINNLSSSASIELNLDIREQSFVEAVNAELESMMAADCQRITREDYIRHRNLYTRLVEWGAYVLSRFLLFLFTHNLKQEKPQ